MPCVYELWPSADLSVPETQPNQGFANRALPVMYLSTANSGLAQREDVPKAVLPDTSKAQQIANAALTTLATARQVLTQATATKLPSMSMAEMREQIAAMNTANCN